MFSVTETVLFVGAVLLVMGMGDINDVVGVAAVPSIALRVILGVVIVWLISNSDDPQAVPDDQREPDGGTEPGRRQTSRCQCRLHQTNLRVVPHSSRERPGDVKK